MAADRGTVSGLRACSLDRGYLAWVPDLPGCMSDGATRAEAIANVRQAISEWIEEAERLGRRIPQPTHALFA